MEKSPLGGGDGGFWSLISSASIRPRPINAMSIHPSLRGVNTLVGERSVFTRKERLLKLMEDGRMEESGSPYGLPKVRTKFKIKTKKKKKDD